jgi:hypothetical protein
VCPYCLALVVKRGTKPLQDAIQSHLAGCRACNGGRGTVQEEKYIRRRQQFEDLVHDLDHDPDWKIIDCTGTWYCPACTERIPQVRMPAGAPITSFIQQAVAKHLAACGKWQRSGQPTDDYIGRARTRAAFMPQLIILIRERLKRPLWRHIDPMGLWICPHCLEHISVPRAATSGSDWSGAVENIAQHLICRCRPFAADPRAVHSDDEVARAGSAAHSISHTPSGGTPLLNRRVGSNARITPVAPITPPGAAPIASTTPVATPVIATPAIIPMPAVTPLPASPTPVPTALPPATEAFQPPGWMRDSGTFAAPPPDVANEAPQAMPDWMRESAHVPIVATPAETADTPDQAAAESAGNAPGESVAPSPLETNAAIPAQTPPMLAPAATSPAIPAPSDEAIAPPPVVRRYNTDVKLAIGVQQRMLQQPPELPGYRFAASFEPCTDISGDFYDFITLPNGKLGIALGDVSGHGVQAGLIMSMAKKTLEIYAGVSDGPADALARTNESLHRDLGGTNFVSMVYAVLDPAARTLTWARAGHNPPLHLSADGTLREIRPAGMVVGMKSGPMFKRLLREEVVALQPGDTFLIFTDGITETMNDQHEEFGNERLHDVMQRHASEGPQVLVERIVDAARQFRGDKPPGDDATLVALRID